MLFYVTLEIPVEVDDHLDALEYATERVKRAFNLNDTKDPLVIGYRSDAMQPDPNGKYGYSPIPGDWMESSITPGKWTKEA